MSEKLAAFAGLTLAALAAAIAWGATALAGDRCKAVDAMGVSIAIRDQRKNVIGASKTGTLLSCSAMARTITAGPGPMWRAPAASGSAGSIANSSAAWRSEFVGMGKALGGGSGWVVLAYDKHGKRLVNCLGERPHAEHWPAAIRLLVLDMFEHAYQMDFGAKAADYVKTVMEAVNWSAADGLFERYSKA